MSANAPRVRAAHYAGSDTGPLAYADLRNVRRQILAVKDPEAQAALFTLLGLVHQLAEQVQVAHQS